MFCKFCGKGIDDNAVFCPECGKNTMRGGVESKRQHKVRRIIVLIVVGLIVVPLSVIGLVAIIDSSRNMFAVNTESPSATSVQSEKTSSTVSPVVQNEKTTSAKKLPYIPPMELYLDGESVAIYKGTLGEGADLYNVLQKEKAPFSDHGGYRITTVEKLSTAQAYLIADALREYPYKKGEVYIVFEKPITFDGEKEEHGYCFCVSPNETYTGNFETPTFNYVGFSYDLQ